MSFKGLLRFKAASRTTRRVVRERYTIHQILLEDGHQQAQEQEQEDVDAGDRRQDDDVGDGLQFPFDNDIWLESALVEITMIVHACVFMLS